MVNEAMTWSPARLEFLLEAWRGKRILVIGDVGVDRYTIGSVERISPEAPVPIVRVEEEKLKLGLAANVADNIQALGGVPLLTGLVGKDRCAEDFRRLLSESGIQARHVIADRGTRTVLKERIVSDRQQLLRVDYESSVAVSREAEQALMAKARELIDRCDAVIVEDYAKGLLNPRLVETVFKTAARKRKPVAVDPNAKSPMSLYRGATILTPNTREAEALAGMRITDRKSLLEVGRKILRATGARHVVVTRGREGMAVFSSGDRQVHLIPTYAREVYDVSGAGDTVIAVLTLAIAAGATIEEAAVLGNLAAGVEVGKRGTATVSPEEVRAAMAHHSPGAPLG